MRTLSRRHFIYLFFSCIECVDRKYGKGTVLKYESEIKKKCNQKCIDVFHKRMKVKAEGKENHKPEV